MQVDKLNDVWRIREELGGERKEAIYLLISDIHFDNPHCDRALLKRHLDKALDIGATIMIFGDLFCAMQGKYDPRGSKGRMGD